jgi:hypothetical protein
VVLNFIRCRENGAAGLILGKNLPAKSDQSFFSGTVAILLLVETHPNEGENHG